MNRSKQSRSTKKNSGAGKIVRRVALVLVTVLVFLILALFSVCSVVANGPSETVRDALVLSAMQASATKWVPGLFLPKDVVDGIVKGSEVSHIEVVPMEEINKKRYQEETFPPEETEPPADDTKPVSQETEGQTTPVTPPETEPPKPKSEWDDAKDGMLFKIVNGPTFKAYVLLIKDPSRVYVGTSSDFKSGQTGMRIFDMAAKENCIACINGGEYLDTGGSGTGDNPMGLTYSKGACVWNDSYGSNFFGITKDNRLVVADTMTKSSADQLGIRDAVSFQWGNVLITNDGTNVTLHRADGNTGLAQRTGIGQRADGTFIMIVTDGRTGSSLGATHNDMIDLMLSYGAVTAGLLDGGSSTMMYYENWYEKYNYPTKNLDDYQMKGLVNKYKAFTNPRRIPTYFCVSRTEE